MLHVTLSKSWEYNTEPFPAFRCNLVYGRNKRDREFLSVKDVTPVINYTVTADNNVLYSGSDKVAAEKAKADFDAKPLEPGNPEWSRNYADLKVGLPTLPRDNFRVIKTKEKGTILIVPGEDKTNRCLLFVGCNGGFRGGESILQDGTTGQILKQCSAGNACESSTEAVVLLEIGQSIAFHTYGRRTNDVYVYTWTGTAIESKHFSKEEWDNRNAVAALTEDIDVL